MHSVAMKKSSSIGFIAGILGAMCFGLIPVFSKPALALGLSPACILTYRFSLAAIMLGIFLVMRGTSLKLGKCYLPDMMLLTLCYCVSGGCLMLGYEYMSGGVTGVIHFTYPVFVLLILLVVYREKVKLSSVLAIIIAIAGIYCLGVLGGDEAFMPGANRAEGVVIVVISGLGYASYMVFINKCKVRKFDSLFLTFWILVFTALVFAAIAIGKGEFVLISDTETWLNFLALALLSTVVANVFVVYSVKVVGSTLASILSAMEPATSVVMCIILFDEALNLPIAIGIALIATAVGIVIACNHKKSVDAAGERAS